MSPKPHYCRKGDILFSVHIPLGDTLLEQCEESIRLDYPDLIIKLACYFVCLFVCVEVLWPSQPIGVMSSTVSLPNHTFTGQA